MDENVTVLIPAYNEGDRIKQTIMALKKIEGLNEIIAIDDGSTDNTGSIMENIENIKVIRLSTNHGKGYAVKAALPFVTSPYVLMADADLSESAIELGKLLNSSLDERTMIVAKYPKPLRKGGFGLVKLLSRKSLLMLATKTSETVLSGQRLLPTEFLKQIKLPDSFGLEYKITLEALRKDMNIIDIPLQLSHRETGRDLKGFIHRGRQFSNILKVVLKEWIQ